MSERENIPPEPVFLGDWFINVDQEVIAKHGEKAVTDILRRSAQNTIDEIKRQFDASPLTRCMIAVTLTAIPRSVSERNIIKAVHAELADRAKCEGAANNRARNGVKA